MPAPAGSNPQPNPADGDGGQGRILARSEVGERGTEVVSPVHQRPKWNSLSVLVRAVLEEVMIGHHDG